MGTGRWRRVSGGRGSGGARMIALVVQLLVVAAALFVAARLLEPRAAFFPSAGETTTPLDFGVPYEPWSIPTRDGETLRAWSLLNPSGRAHVLYFHGNGGNLSVWAPILASVARRGYSVVAIDYRGYGTSTGRPSERGLYRDVEAVVDRFWSQAPRDTPVVYWGRSLGGAMAAYAATIRPPDGLILESTFPDVRSLVRSSPLLAVLALLSSYRFPCAEFMEQVKRPALVIHGDRDSVIPFGQGRALFDRITGPKRFFTIHGGDHNDLEPPDPADYWRVVGDFVASLSRRGEGPRDGL
jgi:uncharacterized protein